MLNSDEQTMQKKYGEDAEKNKDFEENFEKIFTDSELNALAAKQIKAELKGNTVCI